MTTEIQFEIPSVEVMGESVPGTFWYAHGPKLWEFKANEKYKDVPEEIIRFAKWVGINVRHIRTMVAANPYVGMFGDGPISLESDIKNAARERLKELIDLDFSEIGWLEPTYDTKKNGEGPLQRKLTIEDLDILELKHTYKVISKRDGKTIEYPKKYVWKMRQDEFYKLAIKQFERGVPKDGIPPRMPAPIGHMNTERW